MNWYGDISMNDDNTFELHVVNDKKNGYINSIKMSEAELKSKYPKIAIVKKEICMVEENSSNMVVLDIKVFEHIFPKDFKDSVKERMIKYDMEKLSNIIPNDMKNKFCLLFRGKVLASADSLEEIKESQSKYKNLDCTLYRPI